MSSALFSIEEKQTYIWFSKPNVAHILSEISQFDLYSHHI